MESAGVSAQELAGLVDRGEPAFGDFDAGFFAKPEKLEEEIEAGARPFWVTPGIIFSLRRV